MIECGVCFEEYQESDLEQHRKLCVVQLVFRCVICTWDYVSKDGLWIHLAMHEIPEEQKEMHYHETKAKHKLHQCFLCNDQRAYPESSYKNHVQEVHVGSENSKSEMLHINHELTRGMTRNQSVNSDVLEVDQNVSNMPIKSEPITFTSAYLHESQKVQSNNSIDNVVSRLNERSFRYLETDNDYHNMTEQNAELLPIANGEGNDLLLPGMSFACDICGITFPSNHATYYHKKTKHGQMHKCPHCRRIFRTEEYQAHLSSCEKNRISCKLCDSTFELPRNLTRHMKRIHHVRKKPKKEKQPSQDMTFTCDICGTIFSSYHNVQYHKRKDHGRNHKCPHCRSLFLLEEYQAHMSSCEQKERISCALCHSKYRNSVYLARHMKRVHQIPAKRNSPVETVASSSLETSDSCQNDKTLSNVVEKNLTEPCNAKPSKAKCPHCDGEYARGRSLLNHIRNTHRPSDCTICGITFHGVEKARYHKIMKHTQPMFECRNCSKKFYWKKDFKFHSSICDPVKEHCSPEEIDLKMDIKVEETTLVQQDESGPLSADIFTVLHCGESKDEGTNEAEQLRFKIKEEIPEEDGFSGNIQMQ